MSVAVVLLGCAGTTSGSHTHDDDPDAAAIVTVFAALRSGDPEVPADVLVLDDHPLGQGFFISEDGLLMTAYHILDRPGHYVVRDRDAHIHETELIWSDPFHDVAILRIISNEEPRRFHALPLPMIDRGDVTDPPSLALLVPDGATMRRLSLMDVTAPPLDHSPVTFPVLWSEEPILPDWRGSPVLADGRLHSMVSRTNSLRSILLNPSKPLNPSIQVQMCNPDRVLAAIEFVLANHHQLEGRGLDRLAEGSLDWFMLWGLPFSEAVGEIDPAFRGTWGSSPLHYAAALGRTDLVVRSIRAGCDVNQVDADGVTPLRLAIWLRRPHNIDALLHHGADANHQLGSAETPLHLAAYLNSDPGIIRGLIEYGAMIDGVDQHGRTPLMWALHEGAYDAARLLLEAGADHRVRDRNGLTAADFAAASPDPDRAQRILDDRP